MIVTFYSYEGGVGRTQLLCNIAAYLCFYQNKKVLIVDGDLEIPGVHFYFKKPQLKQKGLLNLLSNYRKFIKEKVGIEEATINKETFNNLIESYALEGLAHSKSKQGRIDLMPAGLYDNEYRELVETFDWDVFLEELEGVSFIKLFKKHLQNLDYDFILIDTSAGLSTHSNICNIQIPDANIVVTSPSEKNYIGSKKVIQEIVNSNYIAQENNRLPIIIPILSRLDSTNNEAKRRWIGFFKYYFKQYIHELLRFALNIPLKVFKEKEISTSVVNEYVSETLLMYQTDVAYGGKILFIPEILEIEIETLESQFATIASIIMAFNSYPSINLKLLPFSKEVFEPGSVKNTIRQGEIWEVYNTRKRTKREVIVISKTEFNRFSDWYQVIPLDDANSGRKHPFNVGVRGRNVAIDLISTLPEEFFLVKKASAMPEEMESIRTALSQLFSPN